MWQSLTSDNPLLSEPNNSTLDLSNYGAIDFTSGASDEVREFIQSSIAPSTRRAYVSDLRHFRAWGGTIPATDTIVADYLAAHAETLAPASLDRHVASIVKAHAAIGANNPARSELVRATLRGIKRTHAVAQRQATPLIKEDLVNVLSIMGDRPKDVRDRALLLLGFAGGFRRSELVAINVTDLEIVRQGVIVNIRRSKADQEGNGRRIGIPHGRGRWCPVTELLRWSEIRHTEQGPLFLSIDRHARVSGQRLSAEAVAQIVKQRVAAIGIDPTTFSGHSLRAGLATSAAAAGVSSWKIRQQTGHASDAMLQRYIREGELFVDNAAAALL